MSDANVQADLALAVRAIAHLFELQGFHGRWGAEDFDAFRDVLERRDPPPEPESGAA